VVHPTNPNVVYVAALGAAWKSNPERGLYKTEDGGQSWKLVKFVSDKAGFVDVALDPKNPDVVWAVELRSAFAGRTSCEVGRPRVGGLWKFGPMRGPRGRRSRARLAGDDKGRIGLSVFAGQRRHRLRDGRGLLHRGQKAAPGAKRKSSPTALSHEGRRQDVGEENDANTRPVYYSQVRVHPRRILKRSWFSSKSVLVSSDVRQDGAHGDAGRSRRPPRDVDRPSDPDHFIVGDDGGISITWDGGGNYDFAATLPLAQFYSVSFDFETPYNICAGRRTTDRGAGRAGASRAR
jgi:hypothetical protein